MALTSFDCNREIIIRHLKINFYHVRSIDNVNNSDRKFYSRKPFPRKGLDMKSVAIAVVLFTALLVGCSNSGKSVAPSVPQAQEISSVKDSANSVDYLVVYGEGLHDAAASFVAYRKSISYSAAIVAYSTVASAFPATTGNRPIRCFFNYINSSWAHAPKQVLLLGDAGMHGIPFADTLVFGDTTNSDSGTYSDGGTDSLLKFSVGRIPCATNEQALVVLDKIKKFEANLPNNIRFVVDNSNLTDPLNDMFPSSFHTISALINGTPFSQDSFMVRDFGRDSIVWTDSESNQAKTALFQFLNYGNCFVSYLGHANNAHFSQHDIVNSSDVGSLSAISTFVVCGSFVTDITRDTLLAGEMLLKQNGGAAAVIGNSYYQYMTDEELFQSNFFSGLTQKKYSALGDLFKASAQNSNSITNKTKMLLGDPGMMISR
jgi:hypothetical protein